MLLGEDRNISSLLTDFLLGDAMALVVWQYTNPYADTRTMPVRDFYFCGEHVQIYQNLSCAVTLEANTGQRMWDGSYALASWIEDKDGCRFDKVRTMCACLCA